ncbi:MAG: DNA repair protein RecO [Bacteroidales bacterium]|jgi:DNA repair protein RecO (recombination protein O)|nr:DNA repair protein RecO [Bacteroidales bacterium]
MQQTTLAIVLNAFPYNETSLITKLYTQSCGLKGYIIKGIRRNRNSLSASIFQPLQIIEAEVCNNQKQSLQILRNATITESLSDLRMDIVKSTLTMFLTEIITLSIRDENPDKQMFEFLSDKIKRLNDAPKAALADFHIRFMIDFANILGFNITNYDWETGSQSAVTAFINNPHLNCSKSDRLSVLMSLVSFYEQHITAGRKVVSHHILHEILN